MKLIIACFLILVLVSCSSNNKQQKLIDTFFLKYEQKGVESAIEHIYSSNPFMQNEGTCQRDSLTNMLNDLTKQLGKYEGHELLRKEQISKSLEIQSYLVKYERQPLRFNFILYHSMNKWHFQNFQYDSNITDEINLITDISWYH